MYFRCPISGKKVSFVECDECEKRLCEENFKTNKHKNRNNEDENYF